MNIWLGINNEEKNKLNKTIENELNFVGTLRRETDIINPSIIIEADNLTQYNYMYIPEFGRYYFITGITSIRNNLWEISGKVDVLMSFKDGIYTCPVVLADTENTGSESYISGNVWKTLVKTKTDIISFPSGLNNTGEYILITSGG